MLPESDERAKGVDLPPWWLERVRELVDERKETLGENLTQLGKLLSAAIGREEVWDHSSVSRFLRNKNTTVPMAEAFSELLGLPRPFFVPRTIEEALALTATAKRYDTAKVTSPEQSRRLGEVDALLDNEMRVASLEQQQRRSDDGRRHGQGDGAGGNRRTTRRRPSPSGSRS